MPAPSTSKELLDLVGKSGLVDEPRLAPYAQKLAGGSILPDRPSHLAGLLVRDGLLTEFQAEQFLLGKWNRFIIGKYLVLEILKPSIMAQYFLCTNQSLHRPVMIKVLPTAKAAYPALLERFYREASAVAALDHANIVRAYDICQEWELHFLVMEYVDGASLQEVVQRTGPMDALRACHYVRQAAMGLQQVHEAGMVHRDINPGELLLDRRGTVKIRDMGLARFFNDEEDILAKMYDVLGTADCMAPEQAMDSHAVDIRADIYSLGATFYFCLTGHTPFEMGTVTQKLIWHQTRQPWPIAQYRSDVPPGVVTVVGRMMAKVREERYQSAGEVIDALAPWTQTLIPPPPPAEMPEHCPRVQAIIQASRTPQ